MSMYSRGGATRRHVLTGAAAAAVLVRPGAGLAKMAMSQA